MTLSYLLWHNSLICYRIKPKTVPIILKSCQHNREEPNAHTMCNLSTCTGIEVYMVLACNIIILLTFKNLCEATSSKL